MEAKASPEAVSSHRYEFVLDLSAVSSKERVVLHLPHNLYARTSKSSLGDETPEVHIYIGKKKLSPALASTEGAKSFTIHTQITASTEVS